MEEEHPRARIYWANSLFSQADREFNSKCATILREAGFKVFLPQESGVNILSGETPPTADSIFRVDTLEIYNADILVACIDQETIDCGVACEVGIAYAYGLPIVGLYTDIRQHRLGSSRMYKNLFVVGAIEASGEIVQDIDALVRHLADRSCGEVQRQRTHQNISTQHFNQLAHKYPSFVGRLESWYDPSWTLTTTLEHHSIGCSAQRIMEFGCGTGELSDYFIRHNADSFYTGFDKSDEMIGVARSRRSNPNIIFYTKWEEVERVAAEQPFDIAIVSFVLHDHPRPKQIIDMIIKCLKPGGEIFIVDLSTWDLPRLTEWLRRDLAQPIRIADNRFDARKLSALSTSTNCIVEELEVIMPTVSFPTHGDVISYLEFFGIYSGMDLPLGIGGPRLNLLTSRISQILGGYEYPLIDQRAFIACKLRRPL